MMDTKQPRIPGKPQDGEKLKPAEAASQNAAVARSRRGACVMPPKERKE